ncbi:MAG: tyrosine-type recombinase/integrase [Candidatus Kaistia colombiensis]|nr:MAG: tyrosine-type recombinase/integrase [Kaistia sp.]
MLTDVKARKLEPNSKPISDGAVAGLYLFPSTKAGTGKWIVRYVSPQTRKRRDMGLGRYPDVPIREARTAALEVRRLLDGGLDPLEVRRENVAKATAVPAVPTFEAAARQVHDDMAPGFKNGKHVAQWITTLERYVFPRLGGVAVTDLRAADFAGVLRDIWLSKPETASRVRQRCDKVMSWCAARGFIVASPVPVVDMLLPKQPGKRERTNHHPALPWREIPLFVSTVLRAGRPTQSKLMLEFLILTAVRSGELRGMRWEEVDWEKRIWTIPASRMKAKASHRVPLGQRALEVLTFMKGSYEPAPDQLVFRSRTGGPLSDMALTKLLRTHQVASDTPGRIATAHGFRSSFRDWASEKGYPRDVAERALAHTVKNATEAAYHRTDLLDLRRQMMEVWEAMLSSQ